MKFLNYAIGTNDSPRGSSAFIQIDYNSVSDKVNSSKKHLRYRNWSHSMRTLSLVVSIPNAWISLLITSLNLSASDVVNSMKIFRETEGPSEPCPFYVDEPPS